jgi:hypothetical protein
LIERNNGLDTLSFYQYRRRTNSVGGDHSASAEGLQTQSVSSLEDSAPKAERIPVALLFQCAITGSKHILRTSEFRLILASQRNRL